MHDPMTVAFELKWPFPKRPASPGRRERDRRLYARRFWFSGHLPTLVTIWHVDPETDGSDNSCGWFWPRLTKAQLSGLRHMAQDEARDPWFQRHQGKAIDDPAAAAAVLDGAIDAVARTLRVDLPTDAAVRLRNRLLHNGIDNIRSLLAYKTGWHGNSDDDAYWREENAMDLFVSLAGNILREKRPTWRHPRFHVHHWKVQVHPVLHLKRWLFSRCEVCGGRFPYGYAPVSGRWEGGGPRWFRGETAVRHHGCDRTGAAR